MAKDKAAKKNTGKGQSAVERVVKPLIICLCGSTRFKDDFVRVNREQTMMGHIVVAPGVFAHAGDALTEEEKKKLDVLHFRKIDISDIVLVLNVGGYIGESTRHEIEYALSNGKSVSYLEEV